MTKILILLVAISGVLAVLARHEGFLPYPAAPISISVVQTPSTQGKGDFPGSVDAPPPSSSTFTERLQGFDAANARESGCYEDSVAPLSNGENLRVLKCAQPQTDVPYFGPGAPSNSDTIWLLYWVHLRDPAKPSEGYNPLAHSAYASDGACRLALRRLDAETRATFSENTETAIKTHSTLPVYPPSPTYCKALKNAPPASKKG
jgi:hypothetical protein